MSDQFPELAVEVPEITAAELKARIDAGEAVTILDTRRPADFEAWHIAAPNVRAVNVPFTEFLDGDDPAAAVPDGVPAGPLVTCCAKGISSLFVAEFLAREGIAVEALADGMRGWARLYEARELAADPTVVQFHRPSSGCLAYLIVSDGEAAVVDPLRAFVEEYARAARERGAELVYAIDTHVHADHVSGVRAVAELTGAEIVLPAGAEERGLAFEVPYATVADGDTLAVGEATLEAIHAPGHTTELTAFRVDDILLTADTLFVDGVGRPDLEAGAAGAPEAARRLHATLEELLALPAETLVAPGHAGEDTRPREDGTYAATLGELRASLPLVELDRESFVERVSSGMGPRPNNFEEIIAVNLGRSTADDEVAFELELGPNNCAVAD